MLCVDGHVIVLTGFSLGFCLCCSSLSGELAVFTFHFMFIIREYFHYGSAYFTHFYLHISS